MPPPAVKEYRINITVVNLMDGRSRSKSWRFDPATITAARLNSINGILIAEIVSLKAESDLAVDEPTSL